MAGAKNQQSWQLWTPAIAAQRPDLVLAVERFSPLNRPAGVEAARWLREESLANDPSTKTRLLLADGCVEAFFSLCMSSVRVDRTELERSELPALREQVPAVLLTWIAKDRHSTVSGREIVATAYQLAREASDLVGAVAFVLDPYDEETGEMWLTAGYGLRESKTGRVKKRLWLPLRLIPADASRP